MIRVRHVPDPSTPCCIQKSISESNDDKDENEDRVRWMKGEDEVGYEMAGGSDDCDTSLTEAYVSYIVT